MPWGKKIFSPGTDAFTMIEILIVLAVSSILALALWSTFSTAGKVLTNALRLLQTNKQLLLLDDTLRNEFEQVKTPFWLGTPASVSDQETLILPYVLGERENLLQIVFRDGMLYVTRQERSEDNSAAAFGPFESVAWKSVPPQEHRGGGIEFVIYPMTSDLRKTESDPHVLFFTLGSWPFYLRQNEK